MHVSIFLCCFASFPITISSTSNFDLSREIMQEYFVIPSIKTIIFLLDRSLYFIQRTKIFSDVEIFSIHLTLGAVNRG